MIIISCSPLVDGSEDSGDLELQSCKRWRAVVGVRQAYHEGVLGAAWGSPRTVRPGR